MLVVLRPTFFGSEDLLSTDVSGGVVFLPEASWNPEACLVVVSMGARLFVALSVHNTFNTIVTVAMDIDKKNGRESSRS